MELRPTVAKIARALLFIRFQDSTIAAYTIFLYLNASLLSAKTIFWERLQHILCLAKDHLLAQHSQYRSSAHTNAESYHFSIHTQHRTALQQLALAAWPRAVPRTHCTLCRFRRHSSLKNHCHSQGTRWSSHRACITYVSFCFHLHWCPARNRQSHRTQKIFCSYLMGSLWAISLMLIRSAVQLQGLQQYLEFRCFVCSSHSHSSPLGINSRSLFFPPPLKKRLVIVCARALSPTPPHLALPVSSTLFFFFFYSSPPGFQYSTSHPTLSHYNKFWDSTFCLISLIWNHKNTDQDNSEDERDKDRTAQVILRSTPSVFSSTQVTTTCSHIALNSL